MANETKHTPGPWHTVKMGSFDNIFVDSSSNGSICKVADKTDAEANARLIAAAPDLLKAAQEVEAAIQGLNLMDGALKNATDKLYAAIAKAEGRS